MIDPLKATQRELYEYGIKQCTGFLTLNSLPVPTFLTYEEAFAKPQDTKAFRLLKKLCDGPNQGTGTGYYWDNFVFVNLPRCAKPVARPFANRRSYPGNKTDRTPVGVVAHETGHHVEITKFGTRRGAPGWPDLVRETKSISGYEERSYVPSEAMAETMRLFILNPDLLRLAVPRRYDYLTRRMGLIPSQQLDFKTVLNGHPDYILNAESWIRKY